MARGAFPSKWGAQLFLSPRTMDDHLRKVVAKLDISSRTQLQQHSLED